MGIVALVRMLPSARRDHAAHAVRRPDATGSGCSWSLVVVRAAAIGACAALLAADAPLATVYGLAVVATIAMAGFRPVHSALLPALCADTDELTSANVVRGVVEAAGTLVGPVIAGALLAIGSPAATIAVIAAVALAGALPLAGLRAGTAAAGLRLRRAPLRPRVGRGRRASWPATPTCGIVFGTGFVQSAVRGAMNVFVVVLALDLLDTGDSGVAALSAALGVGGIVGSFGASLLVGSRHLGAWLAVGAALWGAPIAVLGAAPGTVVGLTMFAVVGLANAVIDVPLFSLPVRLGRRRRAGRGRSASSRG